MYKLLQELKEPSVIWEEYPEEPNNPEVLVKGIGRYRLNNLKLNVRKKLNDLARGVANSDDREDWRKAAWKYNNDTLHEMMKTIVAAEKELEEKQKQK